MTFILFLRAIQRLSQPFLSLCRGPKPHGLLCCHGVPGRRELPGPNQNGDVAPHDLALGYTQPCTTLQKKHSLSFCVLLNFRLCFRSSFANDVFFFSRTNRPMKKKGTSAGIPRVGGERPSPAGNGFQPGQVSVYPLFSLLLFFSSLPYPSKS